MKTILALILLGTIATTQAQNTSVQSKVSVGNSSDKLSYYKQRGAEDAKFELAFTAKTKAEEKAFWKEQKAYEKELKERDRKAYRVYMASKKEAYSEHYYHCDGHCQHNPMFYSYAGYYYYGYEQPYYQKSYSPATVNTRISVGTPSLRLGL